VSEERYRSLVENATLGIYRTTPQGRILMANPTMVRMLGYEDFEALSARNLEEKGFEPDYPGSYFVSAWNGTVKSGAWKRRGKNRMAR